MFVQDKTGGIFVSPRQILHPETIHNGDLVRLTGVTNPGDFAHSIIATAIQVLGHGRLPKPKPGTEERFYSG